MKAANVSRKLIVPYLTFESMIFAFMVLVQLGNAGHDVYVAGTLMNELGSRRSLSWCIRFMWMAIISGILALLNKQFRLPTRQETPHILLAGVLHLFMGYMLFVKTTIVYNFHIVILWQPIFPIVIMCCAIFFRMDKWTKYKKIGASLSIVASICLIIFYNIFLDGFQLNFFIVPHIVAAAAGAINLGLSMRWGIGAFTHLFWMALVGTTTCFVFYSFEYWVDPKPPFISYTYQLGMFKMGMTFTFRVISDTIGESIFVFIASKNQIILASVYSSLYSIFVILIYILQGNYSWFLFPYLIMVYLAFSLITYDRKKTSNKLLLKKMKHKYLAKVNCDQISKLNKNFIISADLTDHQLLKVIEADSRNPNLDSIQRVDLKCSRLNSDILKLDRTFSSMLKKPRRVLKQKSHDNINV